VGALDAGDTLTVKLRVLPVTLLDICH
jgi:hypothetical protein